MAKNNSDDSKSGEEPLPPQNRVLVDSKTFRIDKDGTTVYHRNQDNQTSSGFLIDSDGKIVKKR